MLPAWRDASAEMLPSATIVIAGGFSKVDWLNLRFRYVLGFLLTALIIAAALRHVIHIYGGISREEIGVGALLTIPVVLFALAFFKNKRRR
jgi:hypothetical protein